MTESLTTIAANGVRSLHWHGDELVDWVGGGARYPLAGSPGRSRCNYAYRFDAACVSSSREYAVIHERLGTKGLVLHQGQVMREVNRSFYHAHVYEYPICLFTLSDGREVMAHCPDEYNRIEIDELETGKRLTSYDGRKPDDFFHSRLTVSADGLWLMSAGWFWHPSDDVALFQVEQALKDGSRLDSPAIEMDHNSEISSAAFLDNDHLVVASNCDAEAFDDEATSRPMNPGTLGVFRISDLTWVSQAPVNETLGTLIPLKHHALGLFKHPKLIELASGKIIHRWPDIYSGEQSSSIIWHRPLPPPMAWHPERRLLAIAQKDKINVIHVGSAL